MARVRCFHYLGGPRRRLCVDTPPLCHRCRSLEPPIDVKPSALARRYDKYMVPMDWCAPPALSLHLETLRVSSPY